MARLRTSATRLGLSTRVSLMTNFLAIIALDWAPTRLEHARVRRLARYMEVLALQEPDCIAALRHVHRHRPICLTRILPAEPRNFSDLHFVFFL